MEQFGTAFEGVREKKVEKNRKISYNREGILENVKYFRVRLKNFSAMRNGENKGELK